MLFCTVLLPVWCMAQSVLKPSVGITANPADTASICTIPLYLGSFDSSGLQAGDTAYDFKLYSINGDSFSLSQKLSNGKPVLLVSGSYTCPVFRNKVALINSLAATYAGQLEIAVIYTVEAHPTGISSYFGYVNVTQQNQNAGILYSQPATYGERKTVCSDMLQDMSINVPVYLDAPCNIWWNTYGPAPNNAYLIAPNGIVFVKHGWFDRHPDHDIICDIDSLLGLGTCNGNTTGGAFILQPVNPTVSGLPGEVLYAHLNIINTTGSFVDIGVKKMQPNLPSGWETAFCFQVCFSPTEDSITIQVAPYDTADFSFDFFTGFASPDSGSVKVGFRNTNDLSNGYSITFRGFTIEAPTSLADEPTGNNAFSLFPNPGTGNLQLHISLPSGEKEAEIFDASGKLLHKHLLKGLHNTLPTEHLAKGIYYIRVGSTIRSWVKE